MIISTSSFPLLQPLVLLHCFLYNDTAYVRASPPEPQASHSLAPIALLLVQPSVVVLQHFEPRYRCNPTVITRSDSIFGMGDSRSARRPN